jgi:hypothetical protein
MAHIGYLLYYSYFHKWKNIYFRCLYKIWNTIISFYMRKLGKPKTSHRKNEEEGEFESLKVSP